MADAVDVDPDVLLFTQDSIACKFRPPYHTQRIDDAVDSILRGKKKASDFARLEVVVHEGRIWSLDNRRLWVFRKARVPSVALNLVGYNHHSRFTDLMENKPELKSRILKKGYWPEVRGPCRTEFLEPGGNYARPPPPRPINVVDEREETDYDTGGWIRSISTPEWQVPRSRSNTHVSTDSDEESDNDGDRIIRGPEWQVPRSRSNRHVNTEPEENVDKHAVNDSGSQTKVLVGVTILIVVLMTSANFGREGDSKLLRVVKGMSGHSGRKLPELSTRSWAADFGRWILSFLFGVVNQTFARLIPAVISCAFRLVWGLMWRLVCKICTLLFSWKGF